MTGVPDYPLGQTLDFKFTTRAFATGIPTVLAGTPVIEVYEDNSLTQIVVGETLTVDFDGVVGLNNLRIVATGGNGYETGKSYQAIISVGTVGGVSVVGEVVAQFSVERAAAFTAMRGTDSALLAASAPTNFGDLSITVTTGLVDITQAAADKVWSTTVRTLTAFSTALALSVWNVLESAIVTASSIGLKVKNNLDVVLSTRLAPTTAGRTLDITATGAAGIDWANVEGQATSVVLSSTTVGTVTANTDMRGTDNALLAANINLTAGAVDTVTTLTGHTAQTGDSFARIGVAGAGLTNINLPNQTMNITGNLTGSVGSVTGSVGSVVGHTAQTGDTFALANGASGFVALKAETVLILADVTGLAGAAMRGTDSALLASSAPTNFGDLSISVTTGLVSLVADQSTVTIGTVNALGTTAKADVNAEMVDTLTVDTIAELAQGIPAVNPTIVTALMASYMQTRNKFDVTASFLEVHNNAGVVIFKKSLSDDGTTYSEAEAVAGP